MKHAIIAIAAAVIMILPASAMSRPAGSTGREKPVDEYGEELNPAVIEQIPQSKKMYSKKSVQEKDVGANTSNRSPVKKKAKQEVVQKKGRGAPVRKAPPTETSLRRAPVRSHTSSYFGERGGGIQLGFFGPGLFVANKGVGTLLDLGAEGEYFFFERLSAGLRFEAATRFGSTTFYDFMPRARYYIDLNSYPRLSFYAQAGLGLALFTGNGTTTSFDIAIPGGGAMWRWNDHLSFGVDASLHVLVRSSTVIGFTLTPAVRYQF